MIKIKYTAYYNNISSLKLNSWSFLYELLRNLYFHSFLGQQIRVLVLVHFLEVKAVVKHNLASLSECGFGGIFHAGHKCQSWSS